ncbi:RNB family domain-containing protein [Besnoitia besnoiti]|uniref:Ribosomal RNA-processing protein 44 n=1 Tax=Besnoitia besnoiti TaxID=94643 RepID=A0A2A9MC99_BESBE|nr:RNB family domain-containing protein [Besnoitia besnoiti]PFH33293.1 RNB family domain-containing protein [Besnoitia besnoiti]
MAYSLLPGAAAAPEEEGRGRRRKKTDREEEGEDEEMQVDEAHEERKDAQDNRRLITFLKATRRGKIQKIVREIYLRDDLPCGIAGCCLCYDPTEETQQGVLSMDERLLLLDADVALRHIDFLQEDACVNNCLLLSSVLAEVKRRNLQTYAALMSLCRQAADESASESAHSFFKKEDGERSSRCHRKFAAFANDVFRSTFVERQEDETLEARDRRSLFAAARWLSDHVLAAGAAVGFEESRLGKVTILTNGKKRKAEALQKGLDALTVREFVEEMRAVFPAAGEKLAQMDEDEDDEEESILASSGENAAALQLQAAEKLRKRTAFYDAHMREEEINRKLKLGVLHKGKLRMAHDCCWRGVVLLPGGQEVRIRGKKNLNRAVEGDVVAVQLLAHEAAASGDAEGVKQEIPQTTSAGRAAATADESKFEAEAEIKEVEDDAQLFPTAEMTDDEENDEPAPLAAEDLKGKVVGIIRKNRREYCGTIRPFDNPFRVEAATSGLPSEVVFIPADPRIPNIILKTRRFEQLLNKRIVVVIDSWDRFSRNPRGHWTEILGEFGTAEAEANVILREQGVVSRDFSLASMRCLPPKTWSFADMPEAERQARLDLRHVCVCSVDPPGCKDIDDALSLEVLENGNYRVGVHIADVTYFLKEDTALDEEASERCTTVYLVERRTDMLPSLLTTDLCSLVGDQDRLAFSVLWEMTSEGDILSSSFHKTFIHSRAALTYAEAQNMIDDPGDKTELAENLRRLLFISQVIRRKRMEAGALQLASPDVQIIRDTLKDAGEEGEAKAKRQRPAKKPQGESEATAGADPPDDENYAEEVSQEEASDIALYQARDTNRMVEDFMLLANTTVAEKIVEYFPSASLLRRHPDPKEKQLQILSELLKGRGIHNFDFSSSKRLAASLNAVAKAAPDLDFLVRILTTRCMNQAVYFSSGDILSNAQSSKPSITSSLSSAPSALEVSPYFHHYGLAAPLYTHFTSPIRRYADVIVHRMLAAAVGIADVPRVCRNKQKLSQQCELLNLKHRNAQVAGRNSVQYHVYLYFKHKGAKEAVGTVTKVKKNGALVYIHKYGLEGIVFFKEQEYAFDADKQHLTHRSSGETIQIFDSLLVRIEAEHSNEFRPSVAMKLIRKTTDQDKK